MDDRCMKGLRTRSEILSQIIEGSPIATFVIDDQHRVTHWNKACESLTGVAAGDVVGTRQQWLAFYSTQRPVMADLVVDGVVEDKRAAYYGATCRSSSVISGAYEAEGFFPDLGPEGKWLFFTAAPLKNGDGKICGAIETLQDISEEKRAVQQRLESEAKYRAVLEASPDPVVVYDMSGRAVYVNPAFTRVFGWESEEILGHKIRYVPKENRAETRMMIDKVLAGRSFSGVESRRYNKAGQIVDVSISAATYLDREGNKAGSVHFLRDVTRQKRLEARVKAGEKILKLQKALKAHNRRLNESNKKLEKAYAVIKKNLEAGAKIQSSLMPKGPSVINGVRFDALFLPSYFVAGDVYNYFRLDENHVGFYVLDVAGHGIPAAMLSVTLSKALSASNHQESLLKQFMPVPEPPYYRLITPAMAVRTLNERFQADPETMQYFTMVYGVMDTRSRETAITVAGHPLPILLRKGQDAAFVGTGGIPVGMFPDIDYDEQRVHLDQGDRLVLYSDGITECANHAKEQFSEKRLIELISHARGLPLDALMDRIEQALRHWRGSDRFEDDVTLLALEIT
ncbi:MAG: SpoIIE family protein phosphatase [Deltaproteobacteria bacterium]|nr:SpoIIE family protein phosphatase [Deltaproteobacteria bacterium]